MKQLTPVTKIAQRLSWTIGGILMLLPFHAVFTTWAGSNLGHLDLWRLWKEVLILGILPGVVYLLWQQTALRQWLFSNRIVRLYLAYLALFVITSLPALLRGRVNGEALIYGWLVDLRFIGFFIICALVAASSNFLITHWRKILFWPAVGVIGFGLLQRLALPYDWLKHLGYGPDTIPAYQTVDNKLELRRIQSTLRGANPLGAYLVLIIAGMLAARRRLWLATAGLAAGLAAMFFSYSRSAWIGAAIAIGLLVYWSLNSHRHRRWLMLALPGLVAVTAAGMYSLRNEPSTQTTLFHTSSSSLSPSSNDVRSQALSLGWHDVIREPAGRGPGTAGPASFRNNGREPRIAENYFLQVGQEVGIIGIIIFTAINVLVGVELWRRKNDQLAKVLLASLVGITFVNLVSHAWADDTLAYLWWGLAGIALAPDILNPRRKQNVRS